MYVLLLYSEKCCYKLKAVPNKRIMNFGDFENGCSASNFFSVVHM